MKGVQISAAIQTLDPLTEPSITSKSTDRRSLLTRGSPIETRFDDTGASIAKDSTPNHLPGSWLEIQMLVGIPQAQPSLVPLGRYLRDGHGLQHSQY